MLSNFFRALAKKEAAYENPLVSALLYSFCPAAARWWQGGAIPVNAFDAQWAVVAYRSAGITLREALESMGLGSLLSFARRYVHQVEAFRERPQHVRIPAPEQLPHFLPEAIPLNIRHEYAEAFKKMNGHHNFHSFVRLWAFVLPDWLRNLRLPVDMLPRLVEVEISFRDFQTIVLPAWQFADTITIPSGDAHNSACFLTEFLCANMKTKTSWENGRVFWLKSSGDVRRFKSIWPQDSLEETMLRLIGIAAEGPYPPLVGLNNHRLCSSCGYVRICWESQKRKLVPPSHLALDF